MKINNPNTPIKLALCKLKKHFPIGTRFRWGGNVECVVLDDNFQIFGNSIRVMCNVKYKNGDEKKLVDVFDDDYETKFPIILYQLYL